MLAQRKETVARKDLSSVAKPFKSSMHVPAGKKHRIHDYDTGQAPIISMADPSRATHLCLIMTESETQETAMVCQGG